MSAEGLGRGIGAGPRGQSAPRYGLESLIDVDSGADALGTDSSAPPAGRLRRNLHWWLGAALVALALPLLAWQALHRDSRDRVAREGDAARRELSLVRPPETTSALERTIREQAEAVTSSMTPPAAVPPPLPPLGALPSRVTAPLPGFEPLATPGAAGAVPTADAETLRRQRLADEAERRLADALGSPILAIGGSGSGGTRAPVAAVASPLAALAAPFALEAARATAAPAATAYGDRGVADIDRALSGLREAQSGGRPEASLAAAADRQWLQAQPLARNVAPLTVRPSPGARVVLQGTIVPAVLLTEINSDLPGLLTAQVTQDVWDSIDSRYLLIPKGARLVGAYNSDVRPGQARVLAAFTRLILPGGASIDLLGMPAADAQGRAGLTDQVDRHFWQMFGSSFVIAGLASLVQRRENPASTVVVVPGAASGTGAAVSSAAGTVLVETARTVLGRNRSIAPTLVIRQGHRFSLMVQKDFLVPEQEAGNMSALSR